MYCSKWRPPMIKPIQIIKAFLFYTVFLLAGCASEVKQETSPYLVRQAHISMQSGIENYNQFKFSRAHDNFVTAYELFSRYDDPVGIVNSSLNIAKTLIALGQMNDAFKLLENMDTNYYTSLQKRYRDIMLSSIHLMLRQYQHAARVLAPYEDELLTQSTQLDEVTLALLINRTRLAQLSAHAFEKWLSVYEQQISMFRTSPEYMARLYRFKALMKTTSSNGEQADELFDSALEVYRQQANPKGIMATLADRGAFSVQINDKDGAGRYYEELLNKALLNRDAYFTHHALFNMQQLNQGTEVEKQRTLHWLKLTEKPQGLEEIIKEYRNLNTTLN